MVVVFFFFNDTATTEIYTLSLHDALPICTQGPRRDRPRRLRKHPPRFGRKKERPGTRSRSAYPQAEVAPLDRKSTRLNSSHANISYAVFCLKKKIKLIYVLHTSL